MTLAFTKSFPPSSIAKGKNVSMTTRILYPTTYKIIRIEPLPVTVVNFHENARKMGKSAITSADEETVEFLDKTTFSTRVKFASGTNKKPIAIRIAARVVYSVNGYPNVFERVLYSPLSNPLIVTTNSIQWTDSEGILLKMATFGDANATYFVRLANVVQEFSVVFQNSSL